MSVWQACASFIEADGKAAIVQITKVDGSSPREAGAVMVVRADGAFSGTIGGGAFEWQLLAKARAFLQSNERSCQNDFVLGPDLGQCCGGRVSVSIDILDQRDLAKIAEQAENERGSCSHLTLFGAGHVGRALVLALAPLPFVITWIDGREGAFPQHVPGNVTCYQTTDHVAAVDTAPADGFVLIMTHDHGLDLMVTRAALMRADLRYVGLIGSATKRARFVNRLQAFAVGKEAIGRLVCPIGDRSLQGKTPAMIAAGVVVALLRAHEARLACAISPKKYHDLSLSYVDHP